MISLLILLAALDLKSVVESTVTALGLEALARGRSRLDLAIVVESDDARSRDTVEGLLLGAMDRLPEVKAEIVRESYSDMDRIARSIGAEWLLFVEVPSFRAELREIDRGLAAKGTRVVAFVPGSTGTAPRKRQARLVASLPEAPIAIGLCELSRKVLLVLGRRSLWFFSEPELDARRGFELRVDAMPRSPTPSRDVVGSIVCVDGAALIGSSSLARGLEVRFDGERASVVGMTDGMPLAMIRGGDSTPVLVSAIEPDGTNLIRVVRLGTAEGSIRKLNPPIHALLSDGSRTLALSPDGRVEAIDLLSNPPVRTPIGATSGRGAALVPGATLVVATSSVAGPDFVAFMGFDGRDRGPRTKLDGPALAASTIDSSAGISAFVAVATSTRGAIWEVPGP